MPNATQEAIELGKRRLAQPQDYSPEHSGLSAEGRVLPINEALPGGGMVIDKASLKAQSDTGGGELPVHPLSPDRPAIDAQREANRQVAADRQAAAEQAAQDDEDERDPASGNGV